MTDRLKFFLVALILSLPFWWGTNLLEKGLKDFFFSQFIKNNSEIFLAQLNLENQLENLRPLLKKDSPDLEIEAKSAISVLVKNSNATQKLDNLGEEKILFQKNENEVLPIASLTKLITAFLVLKYYDLNQTVEITETAASLPGQPEGEIKEGEKLKAGEVFKVKDLLYSLLLESNNSAAQSLSQQIGEVNFIELMNKNALDLGLLNTHFSNPTGLDQKNPELKTNYSTVEDLTKLTKYLVSEYPLIWMILSTPEFDLYTIQDNFHHKIINTNELLKEEGWQRKIIGGKTGDTPQALGCLILVTHAPKAKGYLINIILSSEDRFQEMKKMIEWSETSYQW